MTALKQEYILEKRCYNLLNFFLKRKFKKKVDAYLLFA